MIPPRSSSKSARAEERRVSARAISKRSSRRSRESRSGEVICNQYCRVERKRQFGSDRNISNYSLGLASFANVERSFEYAQDNNLKEGRTCRFIISSVKFRENITFGFTATARPQRLRTKASPTNTSSRRRDSTKPIRSCIICVRLRGYAASSS